MVILKLIMLLGVFGTISCIGVKMANTYVIRVNNLKQIKKGLKILEVKITYTYDQLPDLFLEISRKIKGDVRKFISKNKSANAGRICRRSMGKMYR